MILSTKVFLIGMPGCGKSTLGRELAERLESPFLDLDDEIEKAHNASIKEIFAERGEDEFRKIEKQQLAKSIQRSDVFIMATGGGTPCFFDNMEVMKNCGQVIFLDVSVETLESRLRKEINIEVRPLLADHKHNGLPEELSNKLNQRRSFYAQANETVIKPDIEVEDLLNLIDQHK